MAWLLPFLAQLGVTSAVAVAAAWGAFALFGRKWMENRFAKSLEKFKHDQQTELEHLRFRINALMDRTTKLHQHEFEVLPQVWSKLCMYLSEAMAFTSPIQQIPDLSRATSQEFEEFISGRELRPSVADRLRSADATERNKISFDLQHWDKRRATNEAFREFFNYFTAKSIFIQADLKTKIHELEQLISAAVLESEFEHDHPNPRPGRWQAREQLRELGPEMRREIEQVVQSRLWEANKLD